MSYIPYFGKWRFLVNKTKDEGNIGDLLARPAFDGTIDLGVIVDKRTFDGGALTYDIKWNSHLATTKNYRPYEVKQYKNNISKLKDGSR